ncbi:MAG: DUF1648 domain-containing protein [Clostridiales bacterium]|jgi:uncharacterized membrane protein|nr:DUF1648 domain-containing protein [Clostridiales bacterium]
MGQKKLNYNRLVDLVCLILLVGVILYLIIMWNSFPDRIPGHYNAAGEIDRMGSKYELFIVPVVAWLMFLGISAIEKYPEVWNTGVTVTEENKGRVYRVIRNMLSTLKIIMVAVFVFLSVNSSLSTPLPIWFTPSYIILIFGTLILFIIRLIQVK